MSRGASLLLASTVVLAGCAGDAANAPTSQPVHVVSVESSRDNDSTTYSAVIAPNAQVDLVFRVAGYVVDVRRVNAGDGRIRELEPGDVISTGTALARVRPADYQAVVDKAHGGRDEATAG